jgi:hypothetical protein
MGTYVQLEETKRAYWAGIFDGEGHVELHRQVTGTRSIRVSVSQKNWPAELRKNGWTEAIQ